MNKTKYNVVFQGLAHNLLVVAYTLDAVASFGNELNKVQRALFVAPFALLAFAGVLGSDVLLLLYGSAGLVCVTVIWARERIIECITNFLKEIAQALLCFGNSTLVSLLTSNKLLASANSISLPYSPPRFILA